MSLYKDNECRKFKEAFYSRMDKVSKDHTRRLCYMMAAEAQSFINIYVQREFIDTANNIVASFLDEFERYSLHFKVNNADKVLDKCN